jgi:NAD(P)-dependent dehydrogenase (short-subunit alcohol dehydrogenase family)
MIMSTAKERSRVWFITGASRGLGRALAQAVLDHGEQLAATARDSAALADLPRRYPNQAIALDLDVTDRSQLTEAVGRAIREFGRIDVLVNNAGYGLLGALEELPDSELRRQFETNLFGVLEVTRAVLPHFRQQRSGHIVQISSLSGVAPNPGGERVRRQQGGGRSCIRGARARGRTSRDPGHDRGARTCTDGVRRSIPETSRADR